MDDKARHLHYVPAVYRLYTALPNYTAWWQRRWTVDSMSRVVTQARRDTQSNPPRPRGRNGFDAQRALHHLSYTWLKCEWRVLASISVSYEACSTIIVHRSRLSRLTACHHYLCHFRAILSWLPLACLVSVVRYNSTNYGRLFMKYEKWTDRQQHSSSTAFTHVWMDAA